MSSGVFRRDLTLLTNGFEQFNIVKVGENAYDVAAAVDIGGRLFEFPEVTPQRWVIIFRPHQRAYT